jgi:hypothetical protein
MILLMSLLLATPIVMTNYIARMLRQNHVRVIDLGVVFIWIVFLYAFLPMLGIWLASLGFGALADDRIGNKVPDPSLVLGVGSSYAAFMMGFAWVYSRQRNPQSHRGLVWQLPTSVCDPRTTFFRSRRFEPIVLTHAQWHEGGRIDGVTGETRELV